MRFNQSEYAGYYHKQMVEAGYPGKLLPFVLNELEGLKNVIDIGGGTGFFAIPLAESGHRVTVVEPSEEMTNILKRESPAGILPSIDICTSEWEKWSGAFHDAAICVHSLYPMRDVKTALELMCRSAGKKIVIVRDSSKMKTLAGAVRKKLGISSNRDLNIDVSQYLAEHSAEWRSVNIYEEREHAVEDTGDEADSILFQLRLEQRFRNDVLKILEEELIIRSGIKIFNAIFSDNAYIFY